MTDVQALRRLLTYALDEAEALEQDEVARLLGDALARLSSKADGDAAAEGVASLGHTARYLQ